MYSEPVVPTVAAPSAPSPSPSPSPSGRRLQAAPSPKMNYNIRLSQYVINGNNRTLASWAFELKARSHQCLKAANPEVRDMFTPVTNKFRFPIKCAAWFLPKAKAADFSHPAFVRKSAPRRRVHGRASVAWPSCRRAGATLPAQLRESPQLVDAGR